MAECDDVPGSNTFVFDCTCLFDNGAADPQDLSCPVGTTCCWNMPCEKWTNELQCVRGGGGSFDDVGVATPHHCAWNADAETCACTPPLVRSNYTILDFVVDSGIALNAPFDCRCPFTTDEQWLRLDVCNPPGVSKLGIKLNFAKPSLDSIGLKGTLAVPAGFSAGGATLEVSIGGVVKTFTLDAKGKATVGTDKAQLTVKAKKGVVAAQDAKLSVKLTKGSFASSLVDEGLVDAIVADVAVTMPVEIKLNGTMYASAQPQTYKAKAGKTGSAK
ncbi:MAG: hypothetical protein ABIR79_12495 [Candidatus Binatia bacterium]